MALLPRIQQYDPLVTSENMASLLPAYTRTPEVMPPTAVPASTLIPVATPQGVQFLTNKGKPAKKGTDTGGYVVPEEGAQYRLTDLRGDDQVVASGVGAEGLQAVFDASQDLSQTLGKKAHWEAEQYNPTTGEWERIAYDPRGGLKGALKKVGDIAGDVALGAGVGLLGAATGGLGLAAVPAALGGGAIGGGLSAAGANVTDIALPVAATFAFPGLSPLVAAGAGSAASSALQGRSLEDTLLRAGISAGTAGLLDVTGASDALGRAVSTALSPAAEQTAEQAVRQAVERAAGDIVVTANPLANAVSNVASQVGSTLLSGAGSDALLNPPATTTPPPSEDTIIVSGQGPTANLISNLAGPVAGATVGGAAPTLTDSTPADMADEDTIIVPGQSPTANLVGGLVGPGAGAVVGDVAQTLTDGAPADPTAQEDTSGGLLNDIIKYYTLGSFGIDALSNLLSGGGSAGATTPYTSQLGPMPTFTRGGFTPYAGDYETYGFGPEFNFFGGAPAPAPATTMGPQASLLNPRPPADRTREEMWMLIA